MTGRRLEVALMYIAEYAPVLRVRLKSVGVIANVADTINYKKVQTGIALFSKVMLLVQHIFNHAVI